MRVLVISGAFPPVEAGEADHAFHLCHRLAERGLDVHVLTSERQTPPGELLPFHVHRVMRGWSWRNLPRLLGAIRRIRPDGVLLFYTDWIYGSRPMIAAVPWFSKISRPRIPFVTQLETNDVSLEVSLGTRTILKILRLFWGSERVDQMHMRALLNGSDHVIVLSDRHRRQLRARFSGLEESRVVVIPPPPILRMAEASGEDRLSLRRMLEFEATDLVVVYFGHINPAKGVDLLLRAVAMVDPRKAVRLLVVGGGTDPASPSPDVRGLIDMAETLGISDRIRWTGRYETGSDVASRYLYAADICVLPFTLGVTLNRSSVAAAAAHGLPIITTRPDVMESAFDDRNNLYLCPRRNPQAIARAIEAVADDKTLEARLRAGALRLAEDYFSWAKAIDQTVEALSGPAGTSGRTAPITSSGTP